MIKQLMIAAGTSALLVGCGSLSGYDGSSKFACAAPEGVTCMSMSGVYANVDAGNIGAKKAPNEEVSHAKEPEGYYGDQAQIAHQAIKSGTPVRTAPRKLRVWWAPWEDSDGDLNDQAYSYMVIDNGRWVMERVRGEIVQSFMPSSAQNTIAVQPAKVSSENTAPASPAKPPQASLGKTAQADADSGKADPATGGTKFPNIAELLKKAGGQ